MGVVIEIICVKDPGVELETRGLIYNTSPFDSRCTPGTRTKDLRRRTGIMPVKDSHTRKAAPCFAFQLVLLMKCMMTRYRPTCLLLSLIVVRIVIVNGIPVMHGPPAFARGIPVLLHR
jgi:hypothetical protein